jgi:hypothetical protein
MPRKRNTPHMRAECAQQRRPIVQGGSMCKDATPQDWAGYRFCDPCGCTVDSRSGGAKVPYTGCGNHTDRGLNGQPWCYVVGGTACKAAFADPLIPGSAWQQCADQNCQCVPATAASDVQWSGVVEIKPNERGCGDHDGRGYEWCWATKGTSCPTAIPATEPSMKTAAWQKCSARACDCILDPKDRPNSAVPLGCGAHFAKTGDNDTSVPGAVESSGEVCYVMGGLACTRNTKSDNIIPGTAWRSCAQDCYGIGSSYKPATKAACSCFNGIKPGPLLAPSLYHPSTPYDPTRPSCVCSTTEKFDNRSPIRIYGGFDAVSSQLLKVLIEEVRVLVKPRWADRNPVCSWLQKLGIPTEIGTSWLGYYDTPIEDLSHGESINIIPGVSKTAYREIGLIRSSGAAPAVVQAMG